MRKADVLIIGSGVIGASISYHLAGKGIKDILVIDSQPLPGLGSTGKATGGFRCQFSTAINIKLSLLSRRKLLNFKEELYADPGFVQSGYLFIASNEKQFNALTEIQKIQTANGVTEVFKANADEIYKLNPFLVRNDNEIYGGVFSPLDGFIKPMNILSAYKTNAEKMGVKFLYNTNCTGFKLSDNKNKISSVQTSEDEIRAGLFINAAGAWAGKVSKLAGIDIPLTPLKRQIAVVKKKYLLSENMPMTIFINDGFHFRQREGETLLLHPEINVGSESFDLKIDESWIRFVKSIGDKRVKKVSGYSVDKKKCTSGLYEITPDKHAIIGKTDKLENFYLANGSSGHGVMHSPAIGEIISGLIINGSFNEFDISALRLNRFAENDLNKGSEYL